jgi:hypothetical protein
MADGTAQQCGRVGSCHIILKPFDLSKGFFMPIPGGINNEQGILNYEGGALQSLVAISCSLFNILIVLVQYFNTFIALKYLVNNTSTIMASVNILCQLQ